MKNKFNKQEKNTISMLDETLRPKSMRRKIDTIAKRVEQKLIEDPKSDLAWEPVPLEAYQADIPEMIQSSWVFAVRTGVNTGAERHPNSHQFMMSYKRTGDLQIWIDETWMSNLLVSVLSESIENRWISVPPNVWHRALVSEENWIVVSFHTANAYELIEERPDTDDEKRLSQRLYVQKKQDK
jgi:hypothetical protein